MSIKKNRLRVLTPSRIVAPIFMMLCFLKGADAQNTVTKVIPAELSEISGLVISKNNLFYVHNDSGDTSRIFAMDAKGNLVSTIYFKGDPSIKQLGVADCEDIAAGPGPIKNKSYIYLGDIGDNASNRPYVTVYRLPEPSNFTKKMQIVGEAIHLKYPNGPQDAETLMVDPITNELLIISKRQDTVGIYSASLKFKKNDTVTMKKQGGLFLPGKGLLKYIVAGDISRDGQQIIIKTYTTVYYWLRKGNEPIAETLKRTPTKLPYTLERQGEAIGFTPDGKSYYCISEGKNAIIYKYALPAK
ncbi:hypothetical protein [Pedobacter yonginense]|nr:hypothetical protein [Pedobacter yonginense]